MQRRVGHRPTFTESARTCLKNRPVSARDEDLRVPQAWVLDDQGWGTPTVMVNTKRKQHMHPKIRGSPPLKQHK